jgi:hypothetical protein
LVRKKKNRSWPLILGALLVFAGLCALPFALPATVTQPWAAAAQRTATISLAPPPAPLVPVALSATAQPVHPDDPIASAPGGDATHEAALVAAEDLRLRTLQHHITKLAAPVVIPVRGGVPTLVLPARFAPYGLSDLQALGAVVALRQTGGYLLIDSVMVAVGATLKLGAPDLTTLLMDSSANGFTSIVTWGGTLSLTGASPQAALTITGWDRVNTQAAQDKGYGRPYIRSVGGRMDLKNVHASSLGFWSGRTGGVAWTGVTSRSATGSAVSSTFTGDTYGAFVSRSDHVDFTDDLFEANQLDGLRLHRGANSSTVTKSASARNGASGFVVSRGAAADVLRGDLAINNGRNGFFLNGQPLVSGAGPSGNQASATQGTILEASEAEANAHTGVLVDGGQGTVLHNNIVCGPITGIAIRAGATSTTVAGNDVRCGGRVALSIGPAVTGTTIAGNTLQEARIGLLIRNSPGVRIINNRITGMSVFGISVRGASPGVVGNGNAISGRGLQPIDVRGGAPNPTLNTSDLSTWQHRSELTVFGYLRYHPLLTTWLVIFLLVILSAVVIRFRRRPVRPYAYTVPWWPTGTAPAVQPVVHNGRMAAGPAARPEWAETAVEAVASGKR